MNYFAQTKGLINAVDMKEYSQQQSDAQLSKIFDDLYDDLVNDIWETAQMNGRTETYRTRYYYKIYISWSGHPPNVYGYVTVDDNDKEKLVFSSYLK